MDRQARRLTSQKEEGESDGGSEGTSDNESEPGTTSTATKDNGTAKDAKTSCSNCCTTQSSQFHNTTKGVFCRTCYSYWRRTGLMRSSTSTRKHESPVTIRNNSKPRKPPRGMHLDKNDLTLLASGPNGQGEAILKALDSEVVSLKRQVQNNKQIISQLKHRIGNGIDEFRPPEVK